jgi:hypothetical protein
MNGITRVCKPLRASVFVLLLLSTLIGLTGCIPAIIGAVAYSGAQSDATKQKFLDDFNKTNLEREKAGLKPIDYCLELRRFDAKMAEQDGECKKQAEMGVKESSTPSSAQAAEVPPPPSVPKP